MSKPGSLPWDVIPDEYQDGSIDDADALAHALSIDYFDSTIEFMNNEEAYLGQSDLDPMDELLAEDDAEWEDDDEVD